VQATEIAGETKLLIIMGASGRVALQGLLQIASAVLNNKGFVVVVDNSDKATHLEQAIIEPEPRRYTGRCTAFMEGLCKALELQPVTKDHVIAKVGWSPPRVPRASPTSVTAIQELDEQTAAGVKECIRRETAMKGPQWQKRVTELQTFR
jgi:hypothetical protein